MTKVGSPKRRPRRCGAKITGGAHKIPLVEHEKLVERESGEVTAFVGVGVSANDALKRPGGLVPIRAEVEGAGTRTSKPMATEAGSTKQSGSDRPIKAKARTNPMTSLCRNWPATESGWPNLSKCQPTSRISGKAVLSAGTMGAIRVNISAKGPLSSGRPRTDRIKSVGGRTF